MTTIYTFPSLVIDRLVLSFTYGDSTDTIAFKAEPGHVLGNLIPTNKIDDTTYSAEIDTTDTYLSGDVPAAYNEPLSAVYEMLILGALLQKGYCIQLKVHAVFVCNLDTETQYLSHPAGSNVTIYRIVSPEGDIISVDFVDCALLNTLMATTVRITAFGFQDKELQDA